MEGENVHLFLSTHPSICDTHTRAGNRAAAQSPHLYHATAVTDPVTLFSILQIAPPTKATLCKKINKMEKNPLKCRCASHKGLCVFVTLHCEKALGD